MDYLTNLVGSVAVLGTLGLAVWAAIDALTRPGPAFSAAGKLSKPAWVAITIGAVVFTLFAALFSLLRLAAVVAAVVYLVDVRPALREVGGRGRGW